MPGLAGGRAPLSIHDKANGAIAYCEEPMALDSNQTITKTGQSQKAEIPAEIDLNQNHFKAGHIFRLQN